MSILWIDYETRSRCDLPLSGAYNYAQHASTDALCIAYAFDDEEVQLWLPTDPFPYEVAEHFKAGHQIRAHNAAFDRLITWYVVCPQYNVPEPALESWYCTAAQARANCFPGSLEDVGRFAGMGMKKDFRGGYLIRQLSIPNSEGKFSNDPELLAEMYDYCKQDVRAMRAVSLAMRQLTVEELSDYHLNEKVNDRGVLVDVPLALAAKRYADIELKEVETLVQDITDGAITSVRSPKMRKWVQARLGPEALKLMTVYIGGEAKQSVDKTVRTNLLAMADEYPDEVPYEVADVLQCATDIWASSVAKFTRMANLADVEDHRVRGAFMFNGGGATGRLSSIGLQLQNMARKTADDPVAVREAMLSNLPLVPAHGISVSEVLKGMLRPALIPAEGNVFVVLDWASIEARLNPWLSNSPLAAELLEAFAAGKDIYVREASKMFFTAESEINKGQRQVGKVSILACGYGGGVKAFSAMGRLYGLVMDDTQSQITVNTWRRLNQWAVQYWYEIEEAYTRAMRNPGYEFTAGRVTYLYDGVHLWYMLPSRRALCYPFAKLDDDGITYAKAAWKAKSDDKEWPRARLWHGIAVENICQAAANDLLRNALRQIDNVVLTAHDEIVIECKEKEAEKVLHRTNQIMCTPPPWCSDLPLATESKIMSRYGK